MHNINLQINSKYKCVFQHSNAIPNIKLFGYLIVSSNLQHIYHNTFPQIFLDDVFFGGYDELSKQAKCDYLNSFK